MAQDKIKLPILWSTRMTPEDIKKAVNDERINQLILRGIFRCRIGSLLQDTFDIRRVVISPSEPHGLISDIYKEDDAWYGDLFIPEIEGWKDLVDNMKDPILHPLINIDSNGEFRIVHFTIMDQTDVDRNRTYNGGSTSDFLIGGREMVNDKEGTVPVVKNMLDGMTERRKERKEKLLSGENVDIDDLQSMDYRIKSYEEYGATGNGDL